MLGYCASVLLCLVAVSLGQAQRGEVLRFAIRPANLSLPDVQAVLISSPTPDGDFEIRFDTKPGDVLLNDARYVCIAFHNFLASGEPNESEWHVASTVKIRCGWTGPVQWTPFKYGRPPWQPKQRGLQGLLVTQKKEESLMFFFFFFFFFFFLSRQFD